MRYRVTYRKRFSRDGEGSDAPQTFLNVADGVIAEQEFVERFEPEAMHNADEMQEDDDFLSLGSEVWEYDIMPGREREFRDAVLNSGMAMELDEVEDIPAIEGQ